MFLSSTFEPGSLQATDSVVENTGTVHSEYHAKG